ncbi:sterol desaturase family protein [Marinomonas pollencensis]|uniref:Sterol desaturase/sphingolipid hydroxylase (Fatty acid hydroxylase superfamily) n=1 Tax=Marinomonas pollencensis TaxID=491954 RepID=A0A3E0DR84_9GAMM|nr:sterol desaturase family protein [Marinomonas pollencensis]REG84825.1 sterol desaturase/sphingolipid hydroxylase (fatty acid hydroxylase superfamily) [Marinomonas pollencensis]
MIDFSLRISIFICLLCLLIIWQWKAPRTPLKQWSWRCFHNLSLLLLGALCVRLIQPLLLSIVAFINSGEGLFSVFQLHYWGQILLGIVALDALIYWQHRLFHRIPLLWRLHQVHHSDQALDVSSALRFHPIEILLSLCIKAIAILALGIPVEAVLAFDILLNACAMFNHTNVRLPQYAESAIKLFIVTPDMHRIHHSVRFSETNSNYGFCLSLWDRIFHSYTECAKGGDDHIRIGLPGQKNRLEASIKSLLLMPFKPPSTVTQKTSQQNKT